MAVAVPCGRGGKAKGYIELETRIWVLVPFWVSVISVSVGKDVVFIWLVVWFGVIKMSPWN